MPGRLTNSESSYNMNFEVHFKTQERPFFYFEVKIAWYPVLLSSLSCDLTQLKASFRMSLARPSTTGWYNCRQHFPRCIAARQDVSPAAVIEQQLDGDSSGQNTTTLLTNCPRRVQLQDCEDTPPPHPPPALPIAVRLRFFPSSLQADLLALI